jgi:hypothetical protein
MGERRFSMKRIATVVSILIAILMLSEMLVGADECMLPVDKTVSSGYSVITFDGITYRIYSQTRLHLTFTKLNDRYHGLTVRPLKLGPIPMWDQEFTVQWNPFPATLLELDSAEGNDYELDTETGYAEKVG